VLIIIQKSQELKIFFASKKLVKTLKTVVKASRYGWTASVFFVTLIQP
jgi:hypothetical protein